MVPFESVDVVNFVVPVDHLVVLSGVVGVGPE